MNRLTYFQAAHLTDQESLEQFIVRRTELDTLLNALRTDDMAGSIQHYLIIGQPGSGKSTLLRRLQAAVNTEPELSTKLVAVNLSEEQAGIYRMHDLWDKAAEDLAEQGIEVPPVNWKQYDNDLVALARASYNAIQTALKRTNKKLLLLLDNIDRVLENTHGPEAKLLRELLLNHKDVRIIGGSTRLSEHHWKYDEPFYEFFRIVRLQPLGQLELRELLLSWSDRLNEPRIRTFVEQHGGRLEALRILSDGTPRTILHLLELVIQRPEDDGFEHLKHIVDRASGTYRERLNALSAHQRKVLLELSFHWEAASGKQLGEAARMDTRTLAAALNKLSELNLVEKVPGKGKNHLYRIQERFFNLWLIMTQGGPKQKRRVKYLTIFLEIWYGREGLTTLLTDYRERLRKGELDAGHAALMTQALARSLYVSAEERDELIQHTRPLVAERKEYADHLPAMNSEACTKALALLDAENYKGAIEELNEVEQETPEKDLLLARACAGLKELETCKTYLQKALALSQKAEVLRKAGFVLSFIGDKESAEDYYLKAIEKGDEYALNSLAVLYHETNKPEQAEGFYLQAIEKGYAAALFNLANLYSDTGKSEQAEAYYLKAIAEGFDPALNNLANLYRETGKDEQAEEYYLKAIDKGVEKAFYNLAHWQYLRAMEPSQSIQLIEGKAKMGTGLNNLDRCQLALLQIWSGRPEEAASLSDLVAAKSIHIDNLNMAFWLTHFLVHNQANQVWACFNSEDLGPVLKERLQPLYFATGKLVGTKGENAIRVMPTELSSTVEDILSNISTERLRYYPPAK